jgi:hypothetical protein
MTAQTDMKFEVVDSSAEEDSEEEEDLFGVNTNGGGETTKP